MGRNCLCQRRRKSLCTRGRSTALPRKGTGGASPAGKFLRRTFLGSTIMRSFMKTKDGKFMACVRKNKKLMLCAKEIQHAEVNAPSVDIVKREPEGNQMAFRFLHGKFSYFLKADGRNLKLDKTVSQSEIQNYTDYWFEKKDGGSAEQYSLQAVVNGRYLSITHKKSIKIPVFELEKDPGDCFFATEID